MFLLIATMACVDGGTVTTDRDPADDTSPVIDDTDDTTPPEICDDGLDNDEDGDADCDDSDCETDNYCVWPFTLNHTSIVDFKGRTIECKWNGFDIDYDVPSCRTVLTSTMTMTTDNECPDCNRTYFGNFTYTQDDCEDGSPRPTEGYYGLVFAENKWVLFSQDESGAWAEAVDLTPDDNGGYSYVSPYEAVNLDTDECNNGSQHVGDINLTLAFEDAD